MTTLNNRDDATLHRLNAVLFLYMKIAEMNHDAELAFNIMELREKLGLPNDR